MEDAKKFNTVDIVIAILIVSANSILKVVADLVAAVPVIGQVIFVGAELYTFFAWTIILIWFIFKLGGFGVVGLALSIGSVLDFFGIPIGLMSGVVFAIIFTNYPRAAQTIGLVAGAGELAAAKEVVAEKAVGAATETAAKTGARTATAGIGEAETASAEMAAKREISSVGEQSVGTGTGAETGTGKSPNLEPEALGEQRELLGNEGSLRQELFAEPSPDTPAPQKEPAAPEKKEGLRERLANKAKDMAERAAQNQQAPTDAEEEDDA